MIENILIYLIILLTGLSVGFVSTIFGIGGGIIMVPLLSLILPYSHLEAIATSLRFPSATPDAPRVSITRRLSRSRCERNANGQQTKPAKACSWHN